MDDEFSGMVADYRPILYWDKVYTLYYFIISIYLLKICINQTMLVLERV